MIKLEIGLLVRKEDEILIVKVEDLAIRLGSEEKSEVG